MGRPGSDPDDSHPAGIYTAAVNPVRHSINIEDQGRPQKVADHPLSDRVVATESPVEEVPPTAPRGRAVWPLGRRNTRWIILATVIVVVAAALYIYTNDKKSHWQQIFSDDFSTAVPVGQFPGTAYKSSWTSYNGFADTSGHGKYDSGILSVKDGLLDMYLHTQGQQPLTAAPIPLVNGIWGGQVYGRYEVRFRSDPLPGYKMAFLLWPDSNNWAEGEIDFPEIGDLTAGNTLYANMYARGIVTERAPGASAGYPSNTAPVDTGWHTATIEWSPNDVTFLLDNVSLGSLTRGVPTTPMHWVLQVETAIDSPAPLADVAGHVQVDWVRIDRYLP